MACSRDSTMSCRFLTFFCQHDFILFDPLWGGDILLSSFQIRVVDGMVGKRGHHLFIETFFIFFNSLANVHANHFPSFERKLYFVMFPRLQ
jgi:hypothetical protein